MLMLDHKMASLTGNTVSVLEFNLEETKTTFHLMQRRYLENNSQAIEQGKLIIWTRQKVDTFIKTIRFERKPVELVDYDVVNVQDEYKLVLYSNENPSEYRFVVPYEECFELVLETHRLFGHRGICKKTYQYISQKYVLDKIWFILMAQACNLCESFRQTEVHENNKGLNAFKQCYQIFTAEMTVKPTAQPIKSDILHYCTLLIVVDKFTSYVCLRPLTTFDEYTVAVELFKIFSDFGIPKSLETSDVQFYENVCSTIGTFIPNHKIPVTSIPSHHTDWLARVMAYLHDWMDYNNCQNWVLGCQSVQWNMNNTVRKNTTPYIDVFKTEPIKDLVE